MNRRTFFGWLGGGAAAAWAGVRGVAAEPEQEPTDWTATVNGKPMTLEDLDAAIDAVDGQWWASLWSDNPDNGGCEVGARVTFRANVTPEEWLAALADPWGEPAVLEVLDDLRFPAIPDGATVAYIGMSAGLSDPPLVIHALSMPVRGCGWDISFISASGRSRGQR